MQTRFYLAGALSEWWSEFYDTYLSTESYSYEYIGGSGIMSLRSIIFGILIGFFVACVVTVFDRRVLGDFVRHVLHNDCLSRESAKTLYELGYHKNSIIRGSLKSGVSLRRVVKCVEEEDFNAETARKRAEFEAEHAYLGKKAPKFREQKFKMDTESMHFYIPEEMKYMADVKFEKKGTGVLTLVLAFVVFAVLALAALFFIPELLQMLDNMIGMFDWKSNVVT